MKNNILFVSLALVLLFSADSTAIDPSSMSVEFSGFTSDYARHSVTRYIVSSADGEFILPEASNQRIINKKYSGGRKIIEIECGVSGNKKIDPPKPSESADARFLNINSKEISSAAEKFRGSRDPAGEIENFVFIHIKDKRYGIPLIPADAVFRARAGDCTEHAVLAAAILRSLKIPARAVVGMIFERDFLGRKNVFVFHMWVEAYFNGRWILIDATRPGNKFLNRYIALAFHNLKTDAPIDYLSAISAISGMKIDYAGGR